MMPDDLKARVCEAMGLTVEEVDEFDRAMHGPEERAQRAKAHAEYMDYLGAMESYWADEMSVLLPEGMTVRFEKTDE